MLGSTRIPLTPLKRPRQRRAQLTFDSILDAAARILQEDGDAGLTTNHVAERAGVAIGSLYEYFPDKETIIAELTRRTLREMLGEIEGGLGKAMALGDERGIRLAVRLMFRVVEKRRDLVRALWRLPFLAQLDEVKALPRVAAGMARQVAPAFADRLVVRNLDASTYLLTIMVGNAIVHGVAARPRHLSRKELEETLTLMLSAMLSARTAPESG